MTVPEDIRKEEASGVTLLVPAAGQGKRLGGRRKQLRLLGDAPVLVQTLRAFTGHVATMIVAGPPEKPGELERMLSESDLPEVKVVAGGTSRQASVAAALRATPESSDVVLVHDAVRPFIASERIREVIDATRRHGAAALAVPVADTLRRAAPDDGAFGKTVARDGLYRMQTPQGFRKAWLEEAHAQIHDLTATDDVALVQHLGRTVHQVRGDARNIKITTPEDWSLARQLWPSWTEKLQA